MSAEKEIYESIRAVIEEDQAQERQNAVQASEAMQFLERRLREKVIEVPLATTSGKKHVFRVRPMSMGEQNHWNEIRDAVNKRDAKGNLLPISSETARWVAEETAQLLANLCFDKSLDVEYWLGRKGIVDPYDAALFLSASARSVLPEEERIRFLQSPPKDKDSSSV